MAVHKSFSESSVFFLGKKLQAWASGGGVWRSGVKLPGVTALSLFYMIRTKLPMALNVIRKKNETRASGG